MRAQARKTAKRTVEAADTPPDGSLHSLTKTLEDLEARLSRLSAEPAGEAEPSKASRKPVRRRAPAEPTGDPIPVAGPDPEPVAAAASSPSDRLRAVIERRLAGSSRLAIDASQEASGESMLRRRSALGAERRVQAAASEAEALRIQNATLEIVSGIAGELAALKGEVAETLNVREGAAATAMRAALAELRERIESGEGGAKALSERVEVVLGHLVALQGAGNGDAAIETLRADLEGIARLVALGAREESVEANGRRWDAFEARLASHIELDGAARRDLGEELTRLRDTVQSLATQDQVQAVESRWDAFEESCFARFRDAADEALGATLRTEIEALGARIEALSAGWSERSSVAAAATGAAMAKLSERFSLLEEALVELPNLLGIERIEERLDMLVGSVALIAEEQDAPQLDHFIIIEDRLDEIAEAIVAQNHESRSALDMAPIERIEARVAELSSRLDRIGSADGAAALGERVAELSERIEALAAQTPAAAFDGRFEALAARIEAAFARKPDADRQEAFEERLQGLADRLEAVSAPRVDEEAIRSLERQIAILSAQVAGRSDNSIEASDGRFAERLALIEERLEAERLDVVAVARAAAEETVRLSQGTTGESSHVRDLSEDLRKLERLTRDSDDRSIKVFDAVHTTLVKIADRLGTIEREVRDGRNDSGVPILPATMPAPESSLAFVDGGASPQRLEAEAEPAPQTPRGLRAAIARRLGSKGTSHPTRSANEALAEAIAVQRERAPEISEPSEPEPRPLLSEAPSIDPGDSIFSREANRPLEPGSGMPDIASLLERVRIQQRSAAEGEGVATKADFIAAARKAALAAAAESEGLRETDVTAGEPGESRLRRHRKPLLMAAGAVLLALMALPFGRSAIEGALEQGTQTASLEGGERTAVPSSSASEAVPAASLVASSAPQSASADAGGAALPLPVDPPLLAEIERSIAEATPTETAAASPAGPPVAALAAARATPDNVDRAIATASVASTPEPSEAEPAAAPAPDALEVAEVSADGEVLARAMAALPENARADLPATPSAIGPTPLIAAADGGDPMAIFEIGLRLMEGRGGEARPADALVWFAHAAQGGYAPAQYSLGTLFEKGNGVERNAAAARDWYTLAANQGNVRAMHNLAVLYATGVDGASEPVESARWFTLAAEHGMRDSQYNLGILHARGVGVPQDFAQSYKWFSIVGAAGDEDAVAKGAEVKKTLDEATVSQIDGEVALFQPRPRDERANVVDLPAEWTAPGDQTASVDMGRAVRNVQAILGRLGYDAGTPDGIVGARTTDAVRAFQEANGLETSGTIDEALIRELLKQNGANS